MEGEMQTSPSNSLANVASLRVFLNCSLAFSHSDRGQVLIVELPTLAFLVSKAFTALLTVE